MPAPASPRVDLAAAVTRICEQLDTALALLSEHRGDSLDTVIPELDGLLRDAYKGFDNARRYALLFRPPVLGKYDPAKALRTRAAQLPARILGLDAAISNLVLGDGEQALECLRLIQLAAELPHGGVVSTEFYQRHGEPRVFVRLTEGGRFNPSLRLGELGVSWDALIERWAAATQGGEIEAVEEQGLRLHYTGTRPRPASDPRIGAAHEPLQRAMNKLSPWRAAIGHYDPGYASLEETARLYERAAREAEELVREALARLEARD